MVNDRPPRRRARVRKSLRLLASLLTLVVVSACKEKNAFVPPPPPEVTVETPSREAVTNYLQFTGNTQAVSTVQLPARVEGYLVGIHFQDGADVKKGDLLFTIQPEQYRAQQQQAEADVLTQEAALDHAETEFARYTKLFQQKAAPATQVDEWRFQRDSAKAALINAQAQLDLAKLNVSYTRVLAPFDGRMGRHLVDVGNLVGRGSDTVLAEINHIDPIYVYFTINELDLMRVKKLRQENNAPDYRTTPIPAFVGLANEDGYPHEGRIDFTAITVDPSTGTLLVRAVVPNQNRYIVPGLFARIQMPIGQNPSALLIPEVALGSDQLGRYVLVVNDKNVVERRGVKLGQLFGTQRVIEEGLNGDERIIVNGLLRAIPGREVKPVMQEADAAKAQSPSSGG